MIFGRYIASVMNIALQTYFVRNRQALDRDICKHVFAFMALHLSVVIRTTFFLFSALLEPPVIYTSEFMLMSKVCSRGL